MSKAVSRFAMVEVGDHSDFGVGSVRICCGIVLLQSRRAIIFRNNSHPTR